MSKRYEWSGGIVEVDGDIVDLLETLAESLFELELNAQGALTMAAALEIQELRGAGAVWH